MTTRILIPTALTLGLLASEGCGGQPASAPDAAAPFDRLDRPGGSTALPLYLRQANWQLGRVDLSDKLDLAQVGRWVVEHEELPNPKGQPRLLKVVRAPLPFPVSQEEERFKPVGMKVLVKGQEIPFSRALPQKATEAGWRIANGAVVLTYPTLPEAGSIEVVYPRVKNDITRHDPATQPDDPAGFAAYSLTLDGDTRQGLMLPAPARVSWDLTLPPGARFETQLAMEAAPLEFPKSNGAEAVLWLQSGDAEPVEVARQKVNPKQQKFEPWTVDLADWAGKAVKLTLETHPGKNEHPYFDWVFWASPTIQGKPTAPPRRVVVIAFDTFRPDKMGVLGGDRPLTPELDQLARSSVRFDRAWTPAPRTRPSFRAATTGRRPLEAVGATNLGEVFQREGWATAGIVANIHLQPRFDFHKGFESWRYIGDRDAEYQINDALAWLQANQDRDAYLFVHFMDPHLVYRAPGEFAMKFVGQPAADFPEEFNRWRILDWQRAGTLKESWKRQIEDMYDGEVNYLDREIGRFYRGIDALPGDSVVVLHNDHGEEFWEHDGFEHNHTLYQEVVGGLLWIRPGGGVQGAAVQTPATLMDIGPTLFDLVGFKDLPPLDGVSLRPWLDDPNIPGDWTRPIGIAHLQYAHERWGVVWKDLKYILHTGTGAEELFDLKADPQERVNLAPQREQDLPELREQLRLAHGLEPEALGPGWRIKVELEPGDEPVRLHLPAAALGAGVLDPEAIVEHRANLEWGEVAHKLPEEVGKVTLAEGGRVLRFEPGSRPQGVLWVRFADAVSPASVEVESTSRRAPVTVEGSEARWDLRAGGLRILPGTVLVPPPTEQQRILATRDSVEASADEQALLKELGYIKDDEP